MYLLVSTLLAVGLASGSSLCAAEPKAKEPAEKVTPKRDWYPFYGTVASIDKQANTISLKRKEGVRVLKLDSKSTLEIHGKPAVIGSVKVGDYAHGKLHKNSAGNEVITDAKFDKEAPARDKPAIEKETPKTPAPKSKP